MRCGRSVTQLAEHPLYNTILAFCWNSLVFSILFNEKYLVYRSIIPNYKKNNVIKGSTTLMKVTGEQSTVLSFLGFSRNVSRQKLLGYHILILIHRGAKLYSQRRANLKILNSAPGLSSLGRFDNSGYTATHLYGMILLHYAAAKFIKTKMSRDMTKPIKWLCGQRRLRSVWAFAQSDQSLRCPHEESLGP